MSWGGPPSQALRAPPGDGMEEGCGAKTSGDSIREGEENQRHVFGEDEENSEGGMEGGLNFVNECRGHQVLH